MSLKTLAHASLLLQPDIDVMFSLDAPQPFVVLYSMALGKGGQLVMVVIAVLGLWLNTVVCLIAASRLVFAIARDGVLPGSSWIGKVQENGQPKNAVLFTGCVAGVLLCTILPSPVAFTSCTSLHARAYPITLLIPLSNHSGLCRSYANYCGVCFDSCPQNLRYTRQAQDGKMVQWTIQQTLLLDCNVLESFHLDYRHLTILLPCHSRHVQLCTRHIRCCYLDGYRCVLYSTRGEMATSAKDYRDPGERRMGAKWTGRYATYDQEGLKTRSLV
jgi:hypothetical protein